MTYQPPQPPQGQPPQSYPPQGYPPQGYPPQGYAPQGVPPGYGYAPPGYGPPPGSGTPNPDRGPRQFNVFQALFLFYLPKLWRDVGQRWKGIGLRYMYLLLLLTWLPLFVKSYVGFKTFVQSEAPKITSQIPKVSITNGVVSIDRPEPYSIIDPDTGETLVLFDTTGATTEPPPNYPSILVTRRAFHMRESATQIKTTDLSPVQSFQLDSKRVQGWLDTALTWFWPAYPVVAFVSCLWRLLLMLLLAAIGLAFASGTRAPVTYAGLMRLSAIAMTPVILIDTALFFIPHLDLGCGWTIGGFVLDLLMLYFAVRANAPQTPADYRGTPGFPVGPPVAPVAPVAPAAPSPQPWPPGPPT